MHDLIRSIAEDWLTSAASIVVPVLLGYLVRAAHLGAQWLQRHSSAREWANVQDVAGVIVGGFEQSMGGVHGKEAKTRAVAMLAAAFPHISPDLIDSAVEAAVGAIPKTVVAAGGLVNIPQRQVDDIKFANQTVTPPPVVINNITT